MDAFTGNLDTVHHVQRAVLSRLTYHLWQTHSELLPDGMSGNSFNYHLNHLISQKLIVKGVEGYTLTPLGRLVIDSMSLTEKRFKLRPACGVLLHVLHQPSGKVLIFESHRQPLMHYNGLPFGKLKVGETYEQTAQRMVQRRGLKLDNVQLFEKTSSFNVRYFIQEDLISHRTGELWKATYNGELVETKTENGIGYWSEEYADLRELANILQNPETSITI